MKNSNHSLKTFLFDSFEVCRFDHIDFVQNDNICKFDLVDHQMNNGTIVIGVVNFETIAEKVTGIECCIEITCINNGHAVVQSRHVLQHWKIVLRINFIFTIIFVITIWGLLIFIMIVLMVVIMIVESESESFCDLKLPVKFLTSSRSHPNPRIPGVAFEKLPVMVR